MSSISKLFAIVTFVIVIYAFTKKEKPFRERANLSVPAAVLPIPSEAQMAWHEMELNAFIHFTTNTFTGLEWGKGSENPSIFNPTQLNAVQWVSVLKKAGFKQVILTCKHHDGFCLWPSQYTDHSIKNSPYKNGKGDLVKEVSDACKQQGIRFGVYLSPWDRNRPDYGQPAYVNYYRNQLKELFTHYGKVSEMWFDGANGGDGYYGGANEVRKINASTYYDWPTTLALVREMQPSVLFFSDAGPDLRWCGNERGLAGTTNWNTIKNDTLHAGKAGIETLLNTGSEDGDKWIPSEVDVSIRPGWFYHQKEDSQVRTPENLFNIYLSSVGRGSTLLLNVPPDQRGLINENDQKSLEGFRQLLNERFKTNLALQASVTASSFRGNSKTYAASNLNDKNKNSYWATDDDTRKADIEIHFKQKHLVKYITIQEYIKLGQRIKSFSIEALVNNEWRPIANGTTIGYKRILGIDPVETDQLRIHINDAKACPLISNIEVY